VVVAAKGWHAAVVDSIMPARLPLVLLLLLLLFPSHSPSFA
jgi:hypothetical protein